MNSNSFVLFLGHARCARGLSLPLCSEITPGCALGTLGDARDRTAVSHPISFGP